MVGRKPRPWVVTVIGVIGVIAVASIRAWFPRSAGMSLIVGVLVVAALSVTFVVWQARRHGSEAGRAESDVSAADQLVPELVDDDIALWLADDETALWLLASVVDVEADIDVFDSWFIDLIREAELGLDHQLAGLVESFNPDRPKLN